MPKAHFFLEGETKSVCGRVTVDGTDEFVEGSNEEDLCGSCKKALASAWAAA